jgi:hypothetical protein
VGNWRKGERGTADPFSCSTTMERGTKSSISIDLRGAFFIHKFVVPNVLMTNWLRLSTRRAHLGSIDRPKPIACGTVRRTHRVGRQPSLFSCLEVPRTFDNKALLRTKPGGLQCVQAAQEHASSDGELGVVIVDHGSRQPSSNAMLVEFVELYK